MRPAAARALRVDQCSRRHRSRPERYPEEHHRRYPAAVGLPRRPGSDVGIRRTAWPSRAHRRTAPLSNRHNKGNALALECDGVYAYTARGRASEAQRILDELLAEARRIGPGARRAVGREVTFADAAAEWLRYVELDRQRRPSTLRDYRQAVDQVLVPKFGELPLNELTTEMIDAFRAHHVDERRLTARTINRYPHFPQFARAENAGTSCCSTGSSSAPSATTVSRSTPPPASSASPCVADALSRRGFSSGFDELVFPNPTGGLLDDSALRRRYYRALKAAGIAHLRFHDLRHTFGTLAVQEFALSDVKAYMGHADIATTMIYVHHSAPARRRRKALGRRHAGGAERWAGHRPGSLTDEAR